MASVFKFKDLLLEGRLEDAKKKYPNIDGRVIDWLSEEDPSGDNKYLGWLTSVLDSMNVRTSDSSFVDRFTPIIDLVKSFHTNLQKIDSELVTKAFEDRGWGRMIKDSSPAGESLRKVIKNPRDINSYPATINSMETMLKVTEAAKNKLSKSDIKKLEAKVLYNSGELLIVIPKSYRTSCHYGAGTRWCTTNKDSDNYYNRYTSRGTLIYVIDKTQPQSNPWYKSAFFIDGDNGNVEVFDAPDNPTKVSDAMDKLGGKWETIRDVIVNYLFDNKLKGVENFYYGYDVIAWYESKGLDPLELLSSEELIRKVGSNIMIEYMNKRGVNIYDKLPFKTIIGLFVNNGMSYHEAIVKIWNDYKSNGINPLSNMFIVGSQWMNHVLENTVNSESKLADNYDLNEWITLDDFLHQAIDWFNTTGDDIFELMSDTYDNASEKLLRLFNSNVSFMFEFASTMGVNLFSSLEPSEMNSLLRRLFDKRIDALNYVLENIESVRGNIQNYGFGTDFLLESLSSDQIKKLVESGRLSDIGLEGFIKIYGENPSTFWFFLKDVYQLDTDKELINFLRTNKIGMLHKSKLIFSSVEEFNDATRKLINDDTFNMLDRYDVHNVWLNFLDSDYYKLYTEYKKYGLLDRLDPLILIKCYTESPIEETDLKKDVIEVINDRLLNKGTSGSLVEIGKGVGVVIDDICDLENFFSGDEEFLCYDDKLEWLHQRFDSYSDANGSVTNFLDDVDVSTVIKEHLMEHVRELPITLNMDLIDDFDNWSPSMNNDDTFTVDLYDERIQAMSSYQLEAVIFYSKELKRIGAVLNEIYDKVYFIPLFNEVKEVHFDKIYECFGGLPSMTKIKSPFTNGDVIQKLIINYKYLLDDISAYVDDNIWNIERLPKSILSIIGDLVYNSLGRFDGRYNIDVEQMVDEYNPNPQELAGILSEELYKELQKVTYE